MQHVELKDVNKRFGNFDAIKHLSLGIEKGQFCALLGPSGCGKSTLLRMIAGLEEVTDGAIYINGDDVTDTPPAKRKIAMVFQSYALYPHMTVRQNIGFSLSIAHVAKDVADKRINEVARMLQLEQLLDRKPAQLSGGQRQRVAIGRSLVRDPEVFLFDEPLSNLDAMLRVQMRFELAKLHKDLDATMIYVTHDQVEAMTLADKIVVLQAGEISQVGTPLELYNTPANRFVASFIGSPSMNFLPVTAGNNDGLNATLNLKGSDAIIVKTKSPLAKSAGGDKLEMGLRPEHISVTSADDASASIKGSVSIVEQLGNSTIFYVETPAGQFVVEEDGAKTAKSGDNVGLVFDKDNIHVFGSNGLTV